MDLDAGTSNRRVKAWFYPAAAVVAVAALIYVWISNISPIMADTVYKQGFNLAQSQQWPRAVPYLKQSLSYAPNEDYYGLYLGQAYLELATTEARNAAQDKTRLASMQSYLAASERELLRANQLAPLNPDHYANLARLYTRWADLEPARATEMLNKAVGRYLEVVKYAPRNARLWAELAATQASIATNRNDTDITGGPVDKAAMDKAIEYGLKSVAVDDKYDFNRLVLGDIYRFAGRKDEAGKQYELLARIDPLQLASDERFIRRLSALAQSSQVSLEEAIAAFDPAKIVKVDKNNPSRLQQDKAFSVMAQGAVYFYKNRLDEARNALNNSIGMSPNSPYTHAYLSLVFKRQGAATQATTEAAAARDLATKAQQTSPGVQQAVETLLAAG
jgi:tetratricopeptide (TPR) repeat protein